MLWETIQLGFAAVGGWLGWFLGGRDGPLYALIALVVIDYIAGLLCAIAEKKLCSREGFQRISRKIVIFLLIGVAHMLDAYVIRNGAMLRTAFIFFYIPEEGVSLTENAARLGLPIPERLKTVLAQLRDSGSTGNKDSGKTDE